MDEKTNFRLGGNICKDHIFGPSLRGSVIPVIPSHFLFNSLSTLLKEQSLSSLLFANLQHFLALQWWMPLLLVLLRKHVAWERPTLPPQHPEPLAAALQSDFSPREDTGQHFCGIIMFPSYFELTDFHLQLSLLLIVHRISLSGRVLSVSI